MSTLITNISTDHVAAKDRLNAGIERLKKLQAEQESSKEAMRRYLESRTRQAINTLIDYGHKYSSHKTSKVYDSLQNKGLDYFSLPCARSFSRSRTSTSLCSNLVLWAVFKYILISTKPGQIACN